MPANGKAIVEQSSDKTNEKPHGKSALNLHDAPNGDFKDRSAYLNSEPGGQVSHKSAMQTRLDAKSKSLFHATDVFILRLNKLLIPVKDTSSILTTFNYTLHLLAFLDAKAAHIRRRAMAMIGLSVKLSGPTMEKSSLAKLSSLMYETRKTLRLMGLIPIYARARELIRGGKLAEDRVTHLIEVLQCTFDAIFHILENGAFLVENGILPRRVMMGSTVSSMYALAYKAWFVGVSLKIVSWFRYVQLKYRGSSEGETVEKGSWTDFLVPLAWLPLSWQVANWTEPAFSDSHLGIPHVISVLMDLGRTEELWKATE